MQLLLEAELVAVERDRPIEVVDEVADGGGSRHCLLAVGEPLPQRFGELRTGLDGEAWQPQRVEWVAGHTASSR